MYISLDPFHWEVEFAEGFMRTISGFNAMVECRF
jgi:hypothetical protein